MSAESCASACVCGDPVKRDRKGWRLKLIDWLLAQEYGRLWKCACESDHSLKCSYSLLVCFKEHGRLL